MLKSDYFRIDLALSSVVLDCFPQKSDYLGLKYMAVFLQGVSGRNAKIDYFRIEFY